MASEQDVGLISVLRRIAAALEDMNSILADLTVEVINIGTLSQKQLDILNVTYKEVGEK